METQSIPVAETAPAPYVALHLRYLALLRTNPNFRRLWIAQLVSEIGDWFYALAIFDLLLNLTHQAQSVSWAVIVETLPWFFMTPIAGHLVDRFSRRRLMIVADVVRGLIVLGPLLVRTVSQVWLVYLLVGLEVIFASTFEPARTALLPDLVSEDDLLHANALGSATWSVALTLGAALGGTVTALFGHPIAFAADSLSFFISAALIRRIHASEPHLAEGKHGAAVGAKPSGLAGMLEAWNYLRGEPKVLVLTVAKAGLGILAGSLVLLTIFGERVFVIAGRGALAMGLLFSARGIGAAIGPFLGDRWVRGNQPRMWKSVSFCYLVIGVMYVAFSRAPNLPLALLAILAAYMGSSTIWVMVTTLLQLNTDDRFRGRVFALDFGLIMLMIAASNYLLGRALDVWRFTPRQCALALGFVVLIPGLLWLIPQARWAPGNPSS